jgi:hypothetical protein
LICECNRHRTWIKNRRFDPVSIRFFVADVFVELLRTKNVHEASVLRCRLRNAPGAARSRIAMKQQFFEDRGETAFAISPDNVDQALKFRVPFILRDARKSALLR